jgi:hypothetical protein
MSHTKQRSALVLALLMGLAHCQRLAVSSSCVNMPRLITDLWLDFSKLTT